MITVTLFFRRFRCKLLCINKTINTGFAVLFFKLCLEGGGGGFMDVLFLRLCLNCHVVELFTS